MKKYIFGKRFKFENFPKIYACHQKYIELVDKSYEVEELFENGEATDKQLKEIDKMAEMYYISEYALAVYTEFYGKNIILIDRKTKEKINFDDYFGNDFSKLSHLQRNKLSSIIYSNWGWKLPAEYYDKHDNIEKY